MIDVVHLVKLRLVGLPQIYFHHYLDLYDLDLNGILLEYHLEVHEPNVRFDV
jgi:hypothetical protein